MFCVIQKVTNKKPNQYGASKELIVDSYSFGIVGEQQKTQYTYRYSEEKFERPIKDAYKISMHQSYREDGKVKKKQWVICTMGYYDLLEIWPGDCVIQSTLNKKLDEMGIPEEELWGMVNQKLDPITEKIKSEFEKTKEYRTKKRHDNIIKNYRDKKSSFEKLYGADTYDFCYDIYGTLKNKEYLDQLKRQQKANEENKRSYYDGYQNNYNNNYSNYDFSGYFTTNRSNYNEEEKKKLKKIYRVAASKFHPDVFDDNGEMMKFLTKLKEDWGI